MQSQADRYKRLAQAYVTLSDKFNELDVAHMDLKQKVVPVVKALKKSQAQAQLLKQENETLAQTIDTLTAEKVALQQKTAALQTRLDALADLESLLEPATEELLKEAEQQIDLVEETLQEISIDSDPDLSEADKQLLESCQVELNSILAASEALNDMVSA